MGKKESLVHEHDKGEDRSDECTEEDGREAGPCRV